MFKQGDAAVIVATGQSTVVRYTLLEPTDSLGRAIRWPVVTDHGTFEESELQRPPPPPSEPRYTPAPNLDVDMELRRTLLKQLQTTVKDIDLNGHWRSGGAIYDLRGLRQEVLEDLQYTMVLSSAADSELAELLHSATTSTPLTRWIDIGPCFRFITQQCRYCEQGQFRLETNGAVLRLAGEPCAFPNGLPKNEWELNVPSGKLVVANDLRKLFPDGHVGDADLNTLGGLREVSNAYATVGLAHGFVGNTNPGVYQLSPHQFKIAIAPDETVEPPVPFEGEEVAVIGTELWWYSLCDADEFARRRERFVKASCDENVDTLSVRPGVYRFVHDDEVDNGRYEPERELVFATFEWVREPDPVKDHIGAWDAVEINAHAYVQHMTQRWPTLYGAVRNGEDPVPWNELTDAQRQRAWCRVADSALLGSGPDWSDRGFPLCRVDPTVPDEEPPHFRELNHWFSMSRGYGGLFEPVLAPSFAKLAFRVMESIISFGMPLQDAHQRWSRDAMRDAAQRYRELAAQYPELADPWYVRWLSQRKRCTAWIRRLPLYTLR